MAKVLLIFPPLWDPSQPYLSTPLLSAFLKRHGHSCLKLDLNLEFVYYLLDASFISSIKRKIEKNIDSFKELSLLDEDHKQWYQALLVASEIQEEEAISSAKHAILVLKDPELFFNPKELKSAYNNIDLVATLVRAAYWPARFRLPDWNIFIGDSEYSSHFAINLAADKKNNPFLPFLASYVQTQLQPDVDIVGISISYPQLVPALTLARQIRLAGHEGKIVLGGGLVAKILPAILKTPELFEFVDAVVCGEGELPLLEMANRCDAGESWKEIPGVVIGSGKVGENLRAPTVPISELCTPDFEGMPLESYLSPYLVLPVTAARGCYWNKCTFCARRRLYSAGHRVRASIDIVKELHELACRYGARHFLFCDEAVSPQTLSECSELLIGSNIDIRWGAWIRFESGFNNQIWHKARKSGFCYALAGLESYSAKILKRMCKGSTPKIIERQLNDMISNRIHAALFMIFGFPGETDESCKKTVEFLTQRRNDISFYEVHLFDMDILSDVWLNREQYGVSYEKPLAEEMDFCVYLPPNCYSVKDTIGRKRMAFYREDLIEKVGQDLRFRQAMFLYASEGRHQKLIKPHMTVLSDILNREADADSKASTMVHLGDDVKIVHCEFDLAGNRPSKRLKEPIAMLTRCRTGELFPFGRELEKSLQAFDKGMITLENLRGVWKHMHRGERKSSFTLESFLGLGLALGIFLIESFDF